MNCPTCGSECTTPENSITNYFIPVHIEQIKVLQQQLTACQEENKRLKNAIEAIKHLCEDHKKSDSALTHIELIIAIL